MSSGLDEVGTARALAVVGRRIDAPGTEPARFPLARVAPVRAALRAFLERERVTSVVTSAACGADLLALEQAGALGLRRRVVLPFAVERFRETSVVDRPGGFGEIFDEVIRSVGAGGDLVVLDGGIDAEAAYARTNDVILREVLHQGKQAGGESLVVAVWDERPRSHGTDTTASFLAQARQLGIEIHSLRTVVA